MAGPGLNPFIFSATALFFTFLLLAISKLLAPGVFLYSLEVPGAAKAAGLVPAQTSKVCPQTVRRNASKNAQKSFS
ncbi:unnamed protein product [Cuscuta campestris]|uniref:Uncharacterized protein n=1 Tax=Cuscuta campestris TaxID=132261 RepID=A0A484N7Y6_9ASTE|nr:unnamed protein product [Cuscuta campestris]